MKRISFSGSLLVAAFLLLFAACAPTAAPAPSPAAAPAAAMAPEDAAWAKVVEAAKREGKLVIYSGIVFSGEKGSRVMKAFEERYGIKWSY